MLPYPEGDLRCPLRGVRSYDACQARPLAASVVFPRGAAAVAAWAASAAAQFERDGVLVLPRLLDGARERSWPLLRLREAGAPTPLSRTSHHRLSESEMYRPSRKNMPEDNHVCAARAEAADMCGASRHVPRVACP